MDIAEYKTLIEQLKPLVNEPDFDLLFRKITENEAAPVRFQIKMELNRLATACTRVIDMRPRFGEECERFELDGVTHYLDANARMTMENAIRVYGGRYTIGAYEDVSQSIQKAIDIHREEQAKTGGGKPDLYPDLAASMYNVDMLNFGQRIVRVNERMHYATEIKLLLNKERTIAGVSSDLSLNGMKAKFPSKLHLQPDTVLTIMLSGLAKKTGKTESELTLRYRFINVEKTSHQYQWISLERLEPDPLVDALIDDFINQNKRRYRVDIGATATSVHHKGYEDAYMRNSQVLPIFIAQKEGALHATEILRNEHNADTIQYWRDENEQLQLAGLFTSCRLTELAKRSRTSKPLVLYSFKHTHQQTRQFYTATDDELRTKGLTNTFFKVGANRDSWRVHLLHLRTIDKKEAVRPQALPEDIKQKLNLEETLPKEMENLIAPLRAVVFMHDITSEVGTECYRSVVQAEDANTLRCFHMENGTQDVPEETFEFIKQRKEPRYIHRSQLIATHKKQSVKGITRDISISGLRIQLDKPLDCDIGSTLFLNMSELNKLLPWANLTEIPYQVVCIASEGTLISLSLINHQADETVTLFFKQLIQQNRSKLKVVEETLKLPLKAETLRNLIINRIPGIALFVARKKTRWMVTHCGAGIAPPELYSILEYLCTLTIRGKPSQVNLTPLCRGERFNQLVMRPLRALRPESNGFHIECLIKIEWNTEGQLEAADCLYLPAGTTTDQQIAFAHEAQQNGEFMALRISMGRNQYPNIHSLNEELHYVREYAAHKAKELEQDLSTNFGVGEILDITQEYLIRLSLFK